MNQVLLQTALLVIVGLLAWGLSWLFRCQPLSIHLHDVRRSGRCALFATGIVLLASTLLIPYALMLNLMFKPVTNLNDMSVTDLMLKILINTPIFLVWLVTPGIFMFKNKESLATAGFGRRNLFKSTAVGLILSLLCCGIVWEKLEVLTFKHILILLPKAQTAFGEEFFFRGYLQNRLMAWLGSIKGWIAASVIMVLVHLPTLLLVRGTGLSTAVYWCLGHFSISLLLGLLMWRTGNLAAPVLLHTVANWINILR